MKIVTVLFISFLTIAKENEMSNVENSISIIPQPVMLDELKGEFVIDHNTFIKVNVDNGSVNKIASDFAEMIRISKNYNVNVIYDEKKSQNDNVITFSLSDDIDKYGSEGYSLQVTNSNIDIAAHKPAGIFYAVQTLKQLMPIQVFNMDSVKNVELRIPSVNIYDKPRFTWRGNMLDPSRHFISVDYIKQNLDHLASLKMNYFHWHLTDDQGWRIEIKSLPNLTEVGAWRVDRNDEQWWGREPQKENEKPTYGGFYSQAEIKEIIQYAEDRFITIIPEIDMPGHSQAAIASYPEISCDGRTYYVATGGVAKDNTYCPGKEITFDFVERVINEVIDLFPSEYIHIGGDECNKESWEICNDCQTRISDEELHDTQGLQSYFISRVEKLINARGRKMIGWDEILEGGLAPNATVMSWRGEEGGITAAKAGHDVIMTPHQYCYLDLKQGDPEIEPDYGYSQLLLSTAYSYSVKPEGLNEEESEHILGVQGNLWGESMQTEFDLNYMMFPRLFAISEVAWTPLEQKNFDEFTIRLESALKRLDIMGVNYALSAYNVSVIPRIDNKDSVLVVELNSEIESDIRFTIDGTEPNINSDKYYSPFPILNTTAIKARSFKDGIPYGNLTEKTIQVHKATFKKVEILSQISEKYNCGEFGLTDCLRGGDDFGNKKWMGLEENDFEAIVDLETESKINSVTASFLHDTNPWIFLPEFIEISISIDGRSYKNILALDNSEEANKRGKYVKEFTAEVDNINTRFVKIRAKNIGTCPAWHEGAGGKAWLFIDEIIIQ